MMTDLPSRHFHEECGVFGIFSKTGQDVAKTVYYGLYALQHRGQDSVGIVVNDDGLFTYEKSLGLVGDAMSEKSLSSLGNGNIAVGHVRYATTGADSPQNIQPIVVDHIKGRLALSHNGNLTNSLELREMLEMDGAIFHTSTDSEVISYMIVRKRLEHSSIEEAVAASMDEIKGAYSLVISSPSKLIAVRDPNGFRPLCYGVCDDGSVIFASETCALDAVKAKFVRDIEPGEIAVVDRDGIRFDRSHCGKAERSLCVFEYIYFARSDSVIDGASVSLARQQAGRFLAAENPAHADIVVGVPDSGLEAALGYSSESGIPFAIGFTKNKYIGRTFIAPVQESRQNSVNIKLNPIKHVVEGKRIVLVDDSIVRGTTSKHIVDLLRDAGAKEIHLRISSPLFVAPCYYGTDIDDPEQLIANKHSVDEIADIIGVDSLAYLTLENVRKLTGCDNGFCTACFGGTYPVSPESSVKKSRFERRISENK